MGALGKRESLALLEAAYDAGVRHFDVAPLYGFGQAEACLGEFLAARRGEVTVTTKYGIPPAKNPGLVGLARKLARPLVKALPGMKQRLSSAGGEGGFRWGEGEFTAAEARESLERSLRELKTERVDVWLLHEVTADDLRNSERTAAVSGRRGGERANRGVWRGQRACAGGDARDQAAEVLRSDAI